MSSLQDRRVARMRELAATGLSRQEVADEMLFPYQTVARYGRDHGIGFKHATKDKINNDRADAMSAMFKAGKTLQEIGDLYGLTRERVRQIMAKYRGVTGVDGGVRAKAKLKKEETRARKEAECLQVRGCTLEQLRSLRDMGRASMEAGEIRERTPIGAFTHQRCSARGRGVGWSLTLWQWWTLWLESGKWDQRGRGRDLYVMCRFGDTGAYEIGNVYISTLKHNSSVQPNNPYRKGHRDFEKAMAEKARRAGREDRSCDDAGCDREHYACGMCKRHYDRHRYARLNNSFEARAA